MHPSDLLHPVAEGLYCPIGKFYIDPIQPVDRALITHGHADHARSGHNKVLATQRTLDIMRMRYGADFSAQQQAAEFGVPLTVNGVTVTFHPAGHVLGSAQISVESGGIKIVASGDYKRSPDPTAENFELVPCDVFITEATFGLPVFNHPNPSDEIAKLISSVERDPGRSHMVGVYALGKAQRVIRLLRDHGYEKPLYIHGALKKLCDYYESEGIQLGKLVPVGDETNKNRRYAGEIVLGPPSAFNSPWVRRFTDPLIAFASGWMLVRQRAKQRGVELPLIISDHCDWGELLESIRDTQAEEVWVTHGREEALVRWCQLNQIAARPLNLVGYEDEVIE